MARILRTVALVLAIATLATAGPLASSVTRVPIETTLVVVAQAIGKTPLERYRSDRAQVLSARTPLVAIVRLAQANSPDAIAVTKAQRDGTRITIAIETRRFEGVLHANVSTTPLVEVELGALDPGTYTIDVHETVLAFTKYGHPETATGPQPGMSSQMTFTLS
jgi:hypothetical protein